MRSLLPCTYKSLCKQVLAFDGQEYSLSRNLGSCSLAFFFLHLCSYSCFDQSALVHTLCSNNLLDCEVTGGDWMSVAVHSPSGWPFGTSSESETKHMTVKHDNKISHSPYHPQISVQLHTLTYFIDIHSPLSHIIFVSDDWLLMRRHHVVLTDYDRGPHDTPFVCPLPCLDL